MKINRAITQPSFDALIWFILAISPVGIAIPFMIIGSNICTGAIGSGGTNCNSGFALLDGYFVTIAPILEFSCLMMGFCFLWMAIAGLVWLKFFKAVTKIFSKVKNVKE